jgi:hypothetical protein
MTTGCGNSLLSSLLTAAQFFYPPEADFFLKSSYTHNLLVLVDCSDILQQQIQCAFFAGKAKKYVFF